MPSTARPLEVALMDYSGYKLSILAAGPAPDWATIVATAEESDRSWLALAKKLPDTSLWNLVSAIQEGLRTAVEHISSLKFAARMQLQVVDVLEQFFKGGSEPAEQPPTDGAPRCAR